MADISTAVSMARVPILGENGRISDDYIPAAIGEDVTKAESAAKRAETAATSAEGSATAASQSATGAQGSASAASTSAAQARESATAASGAVTQAQSAQQAAEAAKTAAETAQSAAAGSAQDAKQSATAAAQSAASVADKFIASAQATTLEPGSQATASVADQVLTLGIPRGDKGDKGDQGDKGDPGTGVPDGGTPGQLLSKTDSGTAWVDPPSTGNVLTGEAEGYVAHAEDAYAQKPREVRIKGKTWVNRWPVLSGTHNGITVATDGTGLVTVTGTATADADVTADVSGWATGKSYTTMVGATPKGCSAYFEVQKPSGNTSINATTTGATLNVASDATNCVAGVHVTSGTTVNASFRVMLVDGTEAPDCFTPPASIASVQTGKLVTAGKNLANAENVVVGSGGTVTNNDNSDGSFDFNVTSEGVYAFVREKVTLAPGTYKFSAQLSGSGSAQVILNDNIVAYTNYSFTVNSTNEYELRVVQKSSIQGTVHVSGWQLELGSTATAYEPPTVTETPLPEVELRSLPNGTCDELVIRADGTATVERRTQLVDGEVVSLDTPTTEPQSPVTLPALPAPTFNVYHDGDIPSDTTVTYERDINIALDNLAKQVAGTASAVAVREASTVKKE